MTHPALQRFSVNIPSSANLCSYKHRCITLQIKIFFPHHIGNTDNTAQCWTVLFTQEIFSSHLLQCVGCSDDLSTTVPPCATFSCVSANCATLCFFFIKVPLSCIHSLSMLPHTTCLSMTCPTHLHFLPQFPAYVFTVITLKLITWYPRTRQLSWYLLVHLHNHSYTDTYVDMPKHVFSYTDRNV